MKSAKAIRALLQTNKSYLEALEHDDPGDGLRTDEFTVRMIRLQTQVQLLYHILEDQGLPYYFFTYQVDTAEGGLMACSHVSTSHPFIVFERLKEQSTTRHTLISWREITREEYDLFKNLKL
jgi:hypothetical protein